MNNEFNNQNNNMNNENNNGIVQNNNFTNNNIQQDNASNNIPNQQYQNQGNNINNGINPNTNLNYNQQPYPNYNYQMPKQRNNKPIIAIIIGISIIAVIALVIFIYNKNLTNQNINEYEENNTNNNNVSNIQNENTNSSDTITFSGFEFKKLPGYQYAEESGILSVANSNIAMMLEIEQINFDIVKTSEFQNEFKNQYNSYGYTIGKMGIEQYSSKEVLVAEISLSGTNGLMFITSTNNGYIFFGIIANKSNTFDHSNINNVIEVTKEANYVGGYTGYSKSLDEKTIDIPKFE